MLEIEVYDKQTGERVSADNIVLEGSEQYKSLCYCDIEGFALGESGELYILDECGAYVSCPAEQFTVKLRIGEKTINLE